MSDDEHSVELVHVPEHLRDALVINYLGGIAEAAAHLLRESSSTDAIAADPALSERLRSFDEMLWQYVEHVERAAIELRRVQRAERRAAK